VPTDKRHALALQVVKQEEKTEELGGSTEPNLPTGGANRLASANPLAPAVRIKTRIDIKGPPRVRQKKESRDPVPWKAIVVPSCEVRPVVLQILIIDTYWIRSTGRE